MSQKFDRLIPGLCFWQFQSFPCRWPTPRRVSLQEQLAAQYKLVKMGSDTSGYSVVEKGTLLAIQKGGILSVPYGDQNVLSNKYEGGTIHGSERLVVDGTKIHHGEIWQGADDPFVCRGRQSLSHEDRCERGQGYGDSRNRRLRHLQQDRSADLQQGECGLPVSQGIAGECERPAEWKIRSDRCSSISNDDAQRAEIRAGISSKAGSGRQRSKAAQAGQQQQAATTSS